MHSVPGLYWSLQSLYSFWQNLQNYYKGSSQQSPTFLAPGTGFMEDNFSTDPGWGMVSGWFKHITFKLASCCAAPFLTDLDWCWSAIWRLGTSGLAGMFNKSKQPVGSLHWRTLWVNELLLVRSFCGVHGPSRKAQILFSSIVHLAQRSNHCL